MSVFAPALGVIWKQLEEYGIDPAPLFREQGIEPEKIYDAGARVSVKRYQRLDLKAAEMSKDPFFGLKGSEYFRPAHLGALGFVWLASSSLRTAFDHLHRYARVIQEKLTIDLEEDDKYFYVRIADNLPMKGEALREDGQLSSLTKISQLTDLARQPVPIGRCRDCIPKPVIRGMPNMQRWRRQCSTPPPVNYTMPMPQ